MMDKILFGHPLVQICCVKLRGARIRLINNAKTKFNVVVKNSGRAVAREYA